VFIDGDKEAGVWTAGQVAGLIEDIPTCEELLNRIERVRDHVIQYNSSNGKDTEEVIAELARKVTKDKPKL
jgi:NAD(P)H-dependent flavin oxidoreductase YrpB (nitropropane dioxygenase family)